MAERDVSFLTFFLLWARVQRWTVPDLHVQMCDWLEHEQARVRVMEVFRGAAKSTLFAVYKAWKLYRNRAHRSLVYSADDKLATKLTRDTLNVLRRHPLCAGMLPPKPGAQSFWVNGSTDARNPSMEAVGVNSNATGSRADDADFDDVEVPKNIKTPEARANIRLKMEESTHILVPGWQKTFIGTPHTHDSIYDEQIAGGAAVLKIPLFALGTRYEATTATQQTRFRIGFEPAEDGLYVFAGIGKPARLLAEGVDFAREGDELVFARPPGAVLDIYSGCAWPERFTREEVLLKRQETRTLNGWDSQYQLHAKPVHECRLDPQMLVPYDVQPELRFANGEVGMFLAGARIVSAALRWDPSGGKMHSDVSALALILQDDVGRRYWHRAERLEGGVAETTEDGRRITGGQVWAICNLIEELSIPRIVVETNGIGGFAPAVLKTALKQRRLRCGVSEVQAMENKNKRILEAFEPLLSTQGQLWAHVDVLRGPVWDQMRDWRPELTSQPDDYLDAGAGAVTDTPERIGKIVGNTTPLQGHDWRTTAGTFEAEFER